SQNGLRPACKKPLNDDRHQAAGAATMAPHRGREKKDSWESPRGRSLSPVIVGPRWLDRTMTASDAGPAEARLDNDGWQQQGPAAHDRTMTAGDAGHTEALFGTMTPMVHGVQCNKEVMGDDVTKAFRLGDSRKSNFTGITELTNSPICRHFLRCELFSSAEELWCELLVHIWVETSGISEAAVRQHRVTHWTLPETRRPQLYQRLLAWSREK
ncbi:hypothetical protein THAOC_27816, partial [Thalassiosira oceanica]